MLELKSLSLSSYIDSAKNDLLSICRVSAGVSQARPGGRSASR